MERTSDDFLREHHEKMNAYYVAKDAGHEHLATALLATATSLYTAYDWQRFTEWIAGTNPALTRL